MSSIFFIKIPSFLKLPHQTIHWLDFLAAMTSREIKTRYKHASLGFLWIIFYPLAQMLIMGFIFKFFIPLKIDNYFLFLFAGLLPWNFFNSSILQATPTIVYKRQLIQKANFPKELMILSIVMSNLIHFLAALLLLVIFLLIQMFFFNAFSVEQIMIFLLKTFLLIPLTIWLLLIVIGCSLLFSALNTKYRDVNFSIKAILPLWFYATPILYTMDLIPANLRIIFNLNPLVAVINSFRAVLIGLSTISITSIFMSVGLSILILFIGLRVFLNMSKNFEDWV